MPRPDKGGKGILVAPGFCPASRFLVGAKTQTTGQFFVKFQHHIPSSMGMCKWFLARLLILIKKGGLLQLKFGVVGVGVNIYLLAR